MDPETYARLNHLLLQEGSHLGINHFQTMLSQVLGEDAPLVQQLSNWEAEDYAPEQLLSLESVLRHKVTEATPNFSTREATGRLLMADVNNVRSLKDVVVDLYNVQQLYEWVVDYKAAYDRVVNTN